MSSFCTEKPTGENFDAGKNILHQIHRLVLFYHPGDDGYGGSCGHLCCGSPGCDFADHGCRNLSLAASDHARSAPSPGILALAPASQCTPAPRLVMVATLSPKPGQFLSYETSPLEAMTPTKPFLVAFEGKIPIFFPLFQDPLHGCLF